MRMNDIVLPRNHSLPYFSNALDISANASATEQANININPKLRQRLHLSADENAVRRILFSRVCARNMQNHHRGLLLVASGNGDRLIIRYKPR
jgi:hypothetical protein